MSRTTFRLRYEIIVNDIDDMPPGMSPEDVFREVDQLMRLRLGKWLDDGGEKLATSGDVP